MVSMLVKSACYTFSRFNYITAKYLEVIGKDLILEIQSFNESVRPFSLAGRDYRQIDIAINVHIDKDLDKSVQNLFCPS